MTHTAPPLIESISSAEHRQSLSNDASSTIDLSVRQTVSSVLTVTPKLNVKVCQLTGSVACNQRLIEMGCIPGTELCVEAVLGFGGPVLISLWDTTFAVRRDDAQHIIVTTLS